MSITDIRAIMHLKYIRDKVTNKYPIKYKDFWENNIIERSSARIVRFFKRTRFQSNYNKMEINGKIGYQYILRNDAKSGILFFRYYDKDEEKIISLCDEVERTSLNEVDFNRFQKQKEMVNSNSINGIKFIQNMEFETGIVKDNRDIMKLENYIFYVINNVDLSAIDISFKNNTFETRLQEAIIDQCITDFDITDLNISSKDRFKIIRELKLLRFIDNYDSIIKYFENDSKYEWLLEYFDNKKELIEYLDETKTRNVSSLFLEIISNTSNINSKKMCAGCYNDFDKHNIINENDIIYCFECYSKIFEISEQNENLNYNDFNDSDYSDTMSD